MVAKKSLMMAAVVFGGVLGGVAEAFQVKLANFNAKGQAVVRFDVAGDAVDAHDGEIALFEGKYWLYGTSYDCGFQWQAPGRPFCGFKAYSSTDLVHWTDEGHLFDARGATWQERCDGGTYGCYRPHVIRHPGTGKYVLWVNVYDNRVGFRVFTADKPQGPFVEGPEPALAVNNNAPVRGVNNGDHDTFLDADGKAYLAYTDWRTGGTIVIERLSESLLTGTGEHVKAVTPGATEAPALFRRGAIYYVAYSDPNCGYCATGTSYRTAPSPLGPWVAGKKISANSCGGQPAFVSTLPLAGGGTAYLYGSDLWNNAAKNEALANYFWEPLRFAGDGSIENLACEDTVTLDLAEGKAGATEPGPADRDWTAGTGGFTWFCDIKSGIVRSQAFTASRTGNLTGVSFTTFQDGFPTAGFRVDVHAAGEDGRPSGASLYSGTVKAADIGWSARREWVTPGIRVEQGKRYAVVVSSATAAGCYGLGYRDGGSDPGASQSGGASYSNDGGTSFTVEAGRSLKVETRIERPVGIADVRRAGRRGVHGKGAVDAAGRAGMQALGGTRAPIFFKPD